MTATAALKIAALGKVKGVVTLSPAPVAGPLDVRHDVGRITAPKLFIASSGDPAAIAAALRRGFIRTQ